MQPELKQKIITVLNQQFAFSHFRPGQLEAIYQLMTSGRLVYKKNKAYIF